IRAYSKARAWVQNAPADEVADKEASFFPGIDVRSVSASVKRYQELGCWLGGIGIPQDLYEQALTVFEAEGEISSRHPYLETVYPLRRFLRRQDGQSREACQR